jgi:hypothetical protein
MSLASTQPLTEMKTRNVSCGRYVGLTYDSHMPIVLKSASLNLLEPSGPLKACTGIDFLFFFYFNVYTAIYFQYA